MPAKSFGSIYCQFRGNVFIIVNDLLVCVQSGPISKAADQSSFIADAVQKLE